MPIKPPRMPPAPLSVRVPRTAVAVIDEIASQCRWLRIASNSLHHPSAVVLGRIQLDALLQENLVTFRSDGSIHIDGLEIRSARNMCGVIVV